jgi:hypothetical protein
VCRVWARETSPHSTSGNSSILNQNRKSDSRPRTSGNFRAIRKQNTKSKSITTVLFFSPITPSRSLPQELAKAQKKQTDLLDFPETRMVLGFFHYPDSLLRGLAPDAPKKDSRQQNVATLKIPSPKPNRPVWGWLLVFTIMAFGFCMMIFATVTTIIFDRLKQKLIMRTYNGCHKETQACSFKEIEDVSIVKKGFFDNLNNSIHYVIRVSTSEKKFDLMESGERKNMKERVFLLFLGWVSLIGNSMLRSGCTRISMWILRISILKIIPRIVKLSMN